MLLSNQSPPPPNHAHADTPPTPHKSTRSLSSTNRMVLGDSWPVTKTLRDKEREEGTIVYIICIFWWSYLGRASRWACGPSPHSQYSERINQRWTAVLLLWSTFSFWGAWGKMTTQDSGKKLRYAQCARTGKVGPNKSLFFTLLQYTGLEV